jgi:protein-S-isoprenylcysteine O-methyltransferase Ste14
MGNLAARIAVSFGVTLVVVAVLIFVPAWTLNYWQAWLFLAIYTACTFGMLVYLWPDKALLERRSRGGPFAEKESAQRIIMLLASVGFSALLVIPAFDHRFGWSNVPVSVVVFGDALVAVGFYLEVLVMRENSFAAATIQVSADQRVISTGTYSVIRHPMYAGGTLLLSGIPLALGSYWGLLVNVCFMPVLIWRLLDEEKFLAKNLPGYTEYQAKVRWRLLPGVF